MKQLLIWIPKDVGSIFSLAPKIAKAILIATGADAFSLGQNNGKAAKQIIPHVHIHIIPRYNEKGTVWTTRQISNDAELSELAKKIRSVLYLECPGLYLKTAPIFPRLASMLPCSALPEITSN